MAVQSKERCGAQRVCIQVTSSPTSTLTLLCHTQPDTVPGGCQRHADGSAHATPIGSYFARPRKSRRRWTSALWTVPSGAASEP